MNATEVPSRVRSKWVFAPVGQIFRISLSTIVNHALDGGNDQHQQSQTAAHAGFRRSSRLRPIIAPAATAAPRRRRDVSIGK